MENTSISDLILPTPFNQKTSHNFQLVHSSVNRFRISDLYHLSIWLSRGVSHHGHGLSPVIIYCEVVIIAVTKTASWLLYWGFSSLNLCNLENAPLLIKWLVIKKTILCYKTSHCVTRTFFCHSELLGEAFMCFLISVFDFWFLCHSMVALSSDYLEQKSQQFFQKTVSMIIWHFNYCFHKNQAALSVARIGLKRTHSVKTA